MSSGASIRGLEKLLVEGRDLVAEQAAEIESLCDRLQAARTREEILCLAITNQIDFEWEDGAQWGHDAGWGTLAIEYPCGARPRRFEGMWTTCLDRAADPEDQGDEAREGGRQ